MRYRALRHKDRSHPLIVVDLGYSASKPSCGVAWTEYAKNHQFGIAVRKVAEKVGELRTNEPTEEVVLVLEAPLSGFHKDNGNPSTRGFFEKGRGWYHQPAASVCLAAIQFLQSLSTAITDVKDLWIAEAFLSNKKEKTRHHEDARCIHKQFWDRISVEPCNGSHPISPLIDGVPFVWVF